MAITDPAFRDAVANLGPTVMVMDGGNHVALTDVAHLGEDNEAWQEFLGETVGAGYTATHKYRDKGLSLYYDTSAEPSPDRFNPLATMVMASFDQVPLEAAEPVFGTMVMTAFDFDAWGPRALDSVRLAAGIDAAIENERYAQTVTGQLDDTEPRNPRL